VGSVAGPSLTVDNNSSGPGAKALNLQTEEGKPPMKVNSSKKVAKLNTVKLDGQDSAAWQGDPRGLGRRLEGRRGPRGTRGFDILWLHTQVGPDRPLHRVRLSSPARVPGQCGDARGSPWSSVRLRRRRRKLTREGRVQFVRVSRCDPLRLPCDGQFARSRACLHARHLGCDGTLGTNHPPRAGSSSVSRVVSPGHCHFRI
jgi:hypothetical protein